jgi:hypothetical protein
VETPESLLAVALISRDAHPQNIDGGTEIDYFEPGLFANGGMAAIGADG